jgi:hypothetical protein
MVATVGGLRVVRSESGLLLPVVNGVCAAAEMRATIGEAGFKGARSWR